jgi:2-phospho-L-lactate guanylyltransferase
MNATAVIPLKGFDIAKGRLAPSLKPHQRSSLARAIADHVVHACTEGGFDLTIVTRDASVAEWAADHEASVITDPMQGLDAACAIGLPPSGTPWIIVHGDLPLLDVATMDRARQTITGGRAVIAPSRDGGTNLLGSTNRVSFSYGPGSFHRHLAAIPRPFEVFTGVETILELDTPADLTAVIGIPSGRWLVPHLS